MRVNWGPVPEGISVQVYAVYNTAHKSLFVLARDEREAMSIAYSANHIYSPEVKHADSYGRDCYRLSDCPTRFGSSWSLVQNAIAAGLEGTLHIEEDGQVLIGDELIRE